MFVMNSRKFPEEAHVDYQKVISAEMIDKTDMFYTEAQDGV